MEINPNAESLQRNYELQVLKAKELQGNITPKQAERLAQLTSKKEPEITVVKSDMPLAQPGIIGPENDANQYISSQKRPGNGGFEPHSSSNRTPGQFINRDSNHP
jgi:hypothetical protein